MDDLRAHKLKKAERDIQKWFDLSKEMGKSKDEISVEFEKMVKNANAGKIRNCD